MLTAAQQNTVCTAGQTVRLGSGTRHLWERRNGGQSRILIPRSHFHRKNVQEVPHSEASIGGGGGGGANISSPPPNNFDNLKILNLPPPPPPPSEKSIDAPVPTRKYKGAIFSGKGVLILFDVCFGKIFLRKYPKGCVFISRDMGHFSEASREIE